MDSILVAEDDPVSALFLEQGLSTLARIELAADGLAALALARRTRFALLVLDARLPRLDGIAVLSELRTDPNAASRDSPAIAVSALLDEATRSRIAAAGFDDALLKPLGLEALRTAAARWLGGEPTPLLADEAALAALGGRPELLRKMRTLFGEELPRATEAIRRAIHEGRREDARALLHRLRSSCGFCGTPALEEAVAGLDRALQQGVGIERALARLLAAREALATALCASSPPEHRKPC